MIKYCDIKAAKQLVKKMVRRRRRRMKRSTTAQKVWRTIYRAQTLKAHWAGVRSPQRQRLLNSSELKLNNNDSCGESALWVKGRTQTDS